MSKKKQRSRRDPTLDYLRGIAVLLMIITHTNGLFYAGTSGILDWFTWWGATVCFTMFLFVSASTTGIKIYLEKVDTRKMGVTIVRLLFTYYITAIILVLLDKGLHEARFSIPEILLFRQIPEFTEFMIAFILFSGVILLIPKRIMKLSLSLKYIIPFSIVSYIVGVIWFYSPLGDTVIPVIKALFAGNSELHTFGILTYLPVYGLGLWWGGQIGKNRKPNIKSAFIIFAITIAFFVLLYISRLSSWERWPPSIAFLSYGIWFSFLIISVSKILLKVPILTNIVTFLGKNALYYYMAHIILLYFLVFITKGIRFTGISTLLILAIVMMFCTGLILQYSLLKRRFVRTK